MKAVFPRNMHILNWFCEDSLSQKSRTKKNAAGVIHACIIIIWVPTSIIELQSQLYVSWRLITRNLPHCGSQTHIRCVELGVVESIYEVGSELHSEPLSNGEVLMQTEVDIT